MNANVRSTEGSEPVPPERRSSLVPVPLHRTVIAEFQSDALELEERDPPRVARITLYGIIALLGSTALWASLASVDEVVVAPGKLVTTKPTIVVQPLETSIIRSIDVAVGETVHAGQTLARLDATFSQSDVDQLEAKFRAFDAQVKRMEAEIRGDDYGLGAGNTADELLQVELFGQRQAFRLSQLQNFDQQIAGQAADLQSGTEQEAILAARRENLQLIETARDTLYKKEFGSLVNLLSSRDARLDVDASIAALHGKRAQGTHLLAKLKADRQAFIDDFRRTTMEKLVEVRNQRDTVDEELKKMKLRRNLVALTAPADAVVLDLAQRSIGSVVREAEPIVTLVPLNVPLEAEVSVNARDIGRIETGDAVRVKFDAYPFQKYGTAAGSIRTISRDAFTPNQQETTASQSALPYFRARVALSDNRLKVDGVPVSLLPGMSVSSEIKVGRRTVMSYLLYPILRGLDNAIREP
ncbi:HlyD family secretion protein [Kaistia soli DSM 19436]|uniref:Membrane fusion protein (MFP) family protein n=1 Tax=Kaistia soli DSM 19436 TaxID=1122133 RepID=A0A1M4Y3Z5_9HYPH|nr:HlyD family type I secretion periplasmic adaptor subunit [Kaistia soli]SHF00425.1 HlyD family secretion protein [Kaistia soli DSM 19436]